MSRATRTSAKTSNTAAGTPQIGKSQVKKFLAKVPEEYVFRCHDGRVLKDMKDLKDALAGMSDQTFAYHSNEVRKDFSSWLKDVVGDEKLAGDLEAASNRERAAKIVGERYTFLVSQTG